MHKTPTLLILGALTGLPPTQVVIAAADNSIAPCSGNSQKGALCMCELTKLHPTQIGIGVIRVTQLAHDSDKQFMKHANKKPAKILIGPAGALYITDGHHHARAMVERFDLHQSQLDKTTCSVIENDVQASFSSDADFWDWMTKNHHARLEGGDLADGRVIDGVFPPASLRDMQDDSYRSLAGFLQDACEIDMSGDYDQFRWADFLRKENIRAPKPSDDPLDTGLAAADQIKNLASKDPQIAKEVNELPGAADLATCRVP